MPYDPNQARVPAGNPNGGEWTSEQLHTFENAARRAAGLPPARVEFSDGNAADLIRGINGLPPHLKGYVTVYSEEEYRKMGAKIYLTEDKLSGFAVKPDGEMISAFSLVRGRGDSIVDCALERGATHLDCYEHPTTCHLVKLYSAAGFVETKRLKWDDQYAPEGWDYERNDNPDVVFMERKEN